MIVKIQRVRKVDFDVIGCGDGFRYKGVLYLRVYVEGRNCYVNAATGLQECFDVGTKVTPMDVTVSAVVRRVT